MSAAAARLDFLTSGVLVAAQGGEARGVAEPRRRWFREEGLLVAHRLWRVLDSCRSARRRAAIHTQILDFGHLIQHPNANLMCENEPPDRNNISQTV